MFVGVLFALIAGLMWGLIFIGPVFVTARNRNPSGSQSAQFSAQIK